MRITQSKIEYFTPKAIILTILTVGISLGYRIIDRKCRTFTRNETNLLFTTGIFNQNTIKIPMNKIEEIVIQRSIIGRIMNYGTLRVNTGGNGLVNYDYIKNINDVLNIQSETL